MTPVFRTHILIQLPWKRCFHTWKNLVLCGMGLHMKTYLLVLNSWVVFTIHWGIISATKQNSKSKSQTTLQNAIFSRLRATLQKKLCPSLRWLPSRLAHRKVHLKWGLGLDQQEVLNNLFNHKSFQRIQKLRKFHQLKLTANKLTQSQVKFLLLCQKPTLTTIGKNLTR